MPCSIINELFQYDIVIDQFKSFKYKRMYYFLTHAHSDHMQNINKRIHNGILYMTKVTYELIKPMLTNLSEETKIVTLQYHVPIQLNNKIIVTPLESFHCDGSCMLLFEINNNNKGKKRILVTSDYRYHKVIQTWKEFATPINTLYIDDTWDNIHENIDFPSYNDTKKALFEAISFIKNKHNNKYEICINVPVLGLEPILRELGKDEEIVYVINDSIRETFRSEQLHLLLRHYVIDRKSFSAIRLGNYSKSKKYKKKEMDNTYWILPTCTKFMCDGKSNDNTLSKISIDEESRIIRIFFSPHSNWIENEKMKLLVGVDKYYGCGDTISLTKCMNKKK